MTTRAEFAARCVDHGHAERLIGWEPPAGLVLKKPPVHTGGPEG